MRPTIGADATTPGSVAADPSGKYAQAVADIAKMSTDIQNADVMILGPTPSYGGAIQAYQAVGNFGATTVGPEIDASGAPNVTQPYTQPAWQLNVALAQIGTAQEPVVEGSPGSTPVAPTQADAQSAQSLAKAMLDYYQQAVAAGSNAQKSPPTGNKSGLVAVGLLSLVGGLAWAAWKLHHHG